MSGALVGRWTPFLIEAEIGHFGSSRIVAVHNETLDDRDALKARVASLESYVGSEMARSDYRTAADMRSALRAAESRERALREALQVAVGYVKAVEGQIPTRPNVVTKDRELCEAALQPAEGGER